MTVTSTPTLITTPHRPIGASALPRRNLWICGLGGITPFVGIKLIDPAFRHVNMRRTNASGLSTNEPGIALEYRSHFASHIQSTDAPPCRIRDATRRLRPSATIRRQLPGEAADGRGDHT
jgi:hypothetical protein